MSSCIDEFVIELIEKNKSVIKKLSISNRETILSIRRKIIKLYGRDDFEMFINKTFHLNTFYDPLEFVNFYSLLQRKVITLNISNLLMIKNFHHF